ncbi:MAG: amidohydrolase family protein [Elusimicrobia bacterium]|nr:amidohydrolase family protein [Elusimicrobiota bacterium]
MSEFKKTLIDVHVHLAGLPDGRNGCFISRKMRNAPLFRFVAWRLGLSLKDPVQANRTYVERLVRAIDQSRVLDKAVVLGMDGVYDDEGRLNESATEFMISNDYVFATAAAHPNRLLAGVSINPCRRDALDEVARCAERGAFLVKVLPNTQQFNPGEERFRPFYRALAERKLPFLSHVGFEFSLIGKDQSVGDPARLRMALDEGVTVIAAHGASQGLFFHEPHWKTMKEFVARYPHFFWDASALTLPNRVGMMMRLRRSPEILDRMVFGTDFPLPVFAFPPLLAGKPGGFVRAVRTTNPFDRQAQVMTDLGMAPKPGVPWR